MSNLFDIDSPSLLVFPKIVQENIKIAVEIVGDASRLWPHIKTHKTAEVIQYCQNVGIQNFKAATLAEVQLLVNCNVKTILLAYQPVGPLAGKFIKLAKDNPAISFICLVDSLEPAKHLSELAVENNIQIKVLVDLNVGQNRTGIFPSEAYELIQKINLLKGIFWYGLHHYDGHIHDPDISKPAKEAWQLTELLMSELEKHNLFAKIVVAGGSPTLGYHAMNKNVVCSPGTFVFWDAGYTKTCPSLPFKPAVLLLCRVISRPSGDLICLDVGHKAVAAENEISKRVYFIDHVNAIPVSQSEEHLVIKIEDNSKIKIGDTLLAIPHHICPTVALHEQLFVIENGKFDGKIWKIAARNRI